MAKETEERAGTFDPEDADWSSKLIPRETIDPEDGIEVPEGWKPPEGVKVEEVGAGSAEEDLPEEFRGKSKKELAEALRQARESERGSGAALGDALSKLSEALNRPKKSDEDEPVKPVVPQPGDEKEFWKNVSTDLFDDTKVKDTFARAAGKVFTPAIAKIAMDTMETNRKLSRHVTDKDLWDKYGEEIEKRAKGLVQQYGPDPNIYEVAVKEVKTRHIDEIAEERSKGKENDRIKALEEEIARLKGGASGAVVQNGGFRHTGGGGASIPAQRGEGEARAKRIKPTEEVKRAAKRLGLSVEDYLGV